MRSPAATERSTGVVREDPPCALLTTSLTFGEPMHEPMRPPLHRPLHRSIAATLLSVVLALPLACGKGDDAEAGAGDTAAATTDEAATEGGDASTGSTAAASAPPADAPNPVTAPVTAEDFDRYERGLAAEIAAVRKAIADRRAAKSSADSLSAQFAALESGTQEAGAQAAGVSVDRYRHLDEELGGTVSARVMNPAMLKTIPDSAALKDLPADQQEQARKNIQEMRAAYSDSATYRRIPPELQSAFKARASARLDTLWKELFALRMQAAGIAPQR